MRRWLLWAALLVAFAVTHEIWPESLYYWIGGLAMGATYLVFPPERFQ